MRLFRFLTDTLGRKMMGLTHPVGRELFLDTEAGRVRVLGYRLEEPQQLPLYVNLHGGGFVIGHAEMDGPYMAVLAREAGVKILSVDYRLAPEAMFPVAVEETRGVVKYAREHGAELGIDPERIALGGHSAGGNLCAAALLIDGARHELDVKCLILDYPPLDVHTDPYLKPHPKGALSRPMSRMFDLAYAGTREAAKNPLVSPYYATVEQLRTFPPTLVITASQDSLAAETEAFKDKLVEAGVPVAFRRFEGVRHGFSHTKEPAAGEAWRLMSDHLKQFLIGQST